MSEESLLKTPEEIKKGLELCNSHTDCEGCPYLEGEVFQCYDRMKADSLAYIQQLESRLAQVERERDAVMTYLKEAGCEHCKHAPSPNDIYIRNECCDCVRHCNFEWRGVCADNTKESDPNAHS